MAAMKLRIMFAVSMLMFLIPAGCTSLAAGPEAERTDLLLDFGNGRTEWFEIDRSGIISSALDSALSDRISYTGGNATRTVGSVDGITETTVGLYRSGRTCSWRIYSWNTVEWEFLTTDADGKYNGSIALGFYPSDALKPAATPEFKDVWTSYRGDSSASGISGSYGPGSVATPVEWYNTYPGAVDCSILYADGIIYHTAAGKYGSVGMDGYARICALDSVNKEVMWTVNYSTSSTEIVTPLIIGDLILVASTNWHIYCLDRYTGEAVSELYPSYDEPDMCEGSKVETYSARKTDSSVSGDRIHLEGGVTNMVFDSGALYFGTSDGIMRCYSIDRDKGFVSLWTCVPDKCRGCFYYSPPVVTDIDGTRCVLMGNYHGSLICVNACTGKCLWERDICYGETGERSGCVSSVSICDGCRALVCYSDGEMSSSGGGMMLLNLSLNPYNVEIAWQYDIKCGRPAVNGDWFYCYVTATPGSAATDYTTSQTVDLKSGYYSFCVDDGSFLWCRDTDALSTGGITYCGGRIYSMDYSPGTEGAGGGWVWCIDGDTGNIVWKAKVAPYSGNSYSMCAPTVVDGMVLVGNDYGAVYILSETPGSGPARSSEIDYVSAGLGHWSWMALIAASAAMLAIAVWIYRK